MKIIFTFFLWILICACNNNIPKEKLTVIDGIILGEKFNDYKKQLDSLAIKSGRYLTKYEPSSYEELISKENYISSSYTSSFNFTNNTVGKNEVLGLLYPTFFAESLGELTVILGHTNSPLFVGDAEKYKNNVDTKYFSQDINSKTIIDIEKMYVSKYGEPKTKLRTIYSPLYVVKGNGITMNKDLKREGEMLVWETDYYTISFFKGLESYNSVYNIRNGFQEVVFVSQYGPVIQKPISSDEIQCYSYCYIEYKLNDKTIKELKLDKPKI